MVALDADFYKGIRTSQSDIDVVKEQGEMDNLSTIE